MFDHRVREFHFEVKDLFKTTKSFSCDVWIKYAGRITKLPIEVQVITGSSNIQYTHTCTGTNMTTFSSSFKLCRELLEDSPDHTSRVNPAHRMFIIIFCSSSVNQTPSLSPL